MIRDASDRRYIGRGIRRAQPTLKFLKQIGTTATVDDVWELTQRVWGRGTDLRLSTVLRGANQELGHGPHE